MSELYNIEESIEQVILVGVATNGNTEEVATSLKELEELANTAGAVTIGTLIQNREQIHPGTYLGKGKLDELRDMIAELGATGVICDDELSPAQLRNMEEVLCTKIMDRTLIILDIFAQHATTREGKIQVELAQLKYRSARLTGLGNSLSRLGGGIGTRGPGEKKLEMDRRLIKDRIAHLGDELKAICSSRDTARKQRMQNHMPVAAIVGYTNAGKSTLLNKLTDAGVLEENKLFATLDPTTRNLTLPSKQEILLTDTVGFIRKLPHHLIDAFRSTLEEAKYADIIIHVVDSSNPQMDAHIATVYETLRKLGVEDKPIITLFNKSDLVTEDVILRDLKADKTLSVSAKAGTGLDTFLDTIEEILRSQKVYLEKTFSYADGGKIAPIRKYGQLLKEEYREDGIYVEAYVPHNIIGQFDL
ncbi:MAG: GTPase HflX [Lachnospiraceae bacterium]|nr:GTPase HflX [Lachnospiraceae bacterium]